jgi:hypothetical protein
MALTAAERSTRARIGAFALHAQRDPRETTRAATVAQLGRFDRLVDPEGKLPPEERSRRARAALRSYMSALSLKASQAKRRKAAVTS